MFARSLLYQGSDRSYKTVRLTGTGNGVWLCHQNNLSPRLRKKTRVIYGVDAE